MLERVARAIFYATEEWTQSNDNWPALPDYGKDVFNDRARAVLYAMHEPTPAIIKAIAESVARDDDGEFPPVCDLVDFSGENKLRTVLAQMWRDGIDAALKENDGAKD
jgi:hypothetical protein